MSLIDLQKKIIKEEEKYFKNFIYYAKKIKKISIKLLRDNNVRVFVFGSVVKKQAIPGKSDIDVLIVSDKLPTKASVLSKLKMEILRQIGDIAAPFEIHFSNMELYEKWYKRHIGKRIEV